MYVLSYFISFIISLFSEGKKSNRMLGTSVLIFFLVLFAGTRTPGIDYDSLTYIKEFIKNTNERFQFDFLLENEFSFYAIPYLSKLIFGESDFLNVTFLVFAFLGVSTKILAINKSRFFFHSVILYCSYLFFYQEMITIRAGVACGIFLLAIRDLEKNDDKAYMIKLFFALLFHYSSIVYFVVWLLLKQKIKINKLYVLLLISFIIAYLQINLLAVFKLESFIPKVKTYFEIQENEGGQDVNVFNFRSLFSFGTLLLFMFNFKKFKDIPEFMNLYRIHILKLFFFFILSPAVMVFSLRIYDMLGVAELLLYPYLILIFRIRVLGHLLIILFSLINLYYIFGATELFKDYSSWLFTY